MPPVVRSPNAPSTKLAMPTMNSQVVLHEDVREAGEDGGEGASTLSHSVHKARERGEAAEIPRVSSGGVIEGPGRLAFEQGN